jgi:hypothetical protein
MERNEDQPEAVSDVGSVDKVRADLERADAEGDEARLETLERIRGDLEAELDSSLENGTTGH